MAYLGERMWRPPAPIGFSDVQSAWIDGLAQRLDIANRIAELVQARIEPAAFIDDRARPARIGRDAQDHRARREPPAGADARDDGAGIPKAVMS